MDTCVLPPVLPKVASRNPTSTSLPAWAAPHLPNKLPQHSDATLRQAMLWASADPGYRASVTRGMDKLGAAIAAWAHDHSTTKMLFPDELFTVIADGADQSLTYDVDALALAHRCKEAILAPDANPLARTLVEGLRTPGSKIRFKGDSIELVPPTKKSLAEYCERMKKQEHGRTVGGPLLRGVSPANVWYDGTAPLDIDALVGNVSAVRRSVVERAAALVNHRWEATPKNTHHGLLADGIWTDTPDETYIEGGFHRSGANIGLPYFWGGFSTPESFDRGITAGLPAGHIFEVTKTFREDNPFTPIGLGVDCSGFVSRAWGLDAKIATGEIAERTTPLDSYDDLKPGDVCMKVWQHVMLFVGRRGDKLLLMESTPPRCIGQAFTADELRRMEMLPRTAKFLDDPTG